MVYPNYWSSEGKEWNRGQIDDLMVFLKVNGFYSNGTQGDRSHIPGIGPAYYFELNHPTVPSIFAVSLTPMGREVVWVQHPRFEKRYGTVETSDIPMKVQILDCLNVCLNEVTNGI